jgi:hypothetical protein
MYLALIAVGGLGVGLALVVFGLRLGFPRPAIAPAAAAAVGLALILLGILVRPHGHPGATPASTATMTVHPMPHYTPTPAPKCVRFTPGSVPSAPPPSAGWNGGLPTSSPADVQRLPAELDPGPPAGGPLVREPGPDDGPALDSRVTAAVAPDLTDLSSGSYVGPAYAGGDATLVMQVAVGTPKPQTCWSQLVTTALVAFGGQHLRPEGGGPPMAAQGLLMWCGEQTGALDMCAWAGPGVGGHRPLFGVMRLTQSVDQSFGPPTDSLMAAYTQRVFAASAGVAAP